MIHSSSFFASTLIQQHPPTSQLVADNADILFATKPPISEFGVAFVFDKKSSQLPAWFKVGGAYFNSSNRSHNIHNP